MGDLDFFLHRPRSFAAVVEGGGGAWRIGRHAWEAMARDSPATTVVLQAVVLRATCLSAAHALEALERGNTS